MPTELHGLFPEAVGGMKTRKSAEKTTSAAKGDASHALAIMPPSDANANPMQLMQTMVTGFMQCMQTFAGNQCGQQPQLKTPDRYQQPELSDVTARDSPPDNAFAAFQPTTRHHGQASPPASERSGTHVGHAALGGSKSTETLTEASVPPVQLPVTPGGQPGSTAGAPALQNEPASSGHDMVLRLPSTVSLPPPIMGPPIAPVPMVDPLADFMNKMEESQRSTEEIKKQEQKDKRQETAEKKKEAKQQEKDAAAYRAILKRPCADTETPDATTVDAPAPIGAAPKAPVRLKKKTRVVAISAAIEPVAPRDTGDEPGGVQHHTDQAIKLFVTAELNGARSLHGFESIVSKNPAAMGWSRDLRTRRAA